MRHWNGPRWLAAQVDIFSHALSSWFFGRKSDPLLLKVHTLALMIFADLSATIRSEVTFRNIIFTKKSLIWPVCQKVQESLISKVDRYAGRAVNLQAINVSRCAVLQAIDVSRCAKTLHEKKFSSRKWKKMVTMFVSKFFFRKESASYVNSWWLAQGLFCRKVPYERSYSKYLRYNLRPPVGWGLNSEVK